MSDHVFLPEQVCYINCSFCNTTLLVYVAPLSLSLAKFLVVLHIQQQRRSVVFLLPITGSSSKSPDEIGHISRKSIVGYRSKATNKFSFEANLCRAKHSVCSRRLLQMMFFL
ncbi:hypothetical protein BHM03_00001123 [Ensete ventricosum]|nr:hypothetical protein BHM03_00001123 [Ensete ventricosum]